MPAPRAAGECDRPAEPASESARALLAIGVRRDIARQLADRPVEHVQRAIASARGRRDVRDLAGWVVSALRQRQPGPDAPPPPRVSDTPILLHPSLSPFEKQRWLLRFSNADPADRPALLARFHAEHPTEETP